VAQRVEHLGHAPVLSWSPVEQLALGRAKCWLQTGHSPSASNRSDPFTPSSADRLPIPLLVAVNR